MIGYNVTNALWWQMCVEEKNGRMVSKRLGQNQKRLRRGQMGCNATNANLWLNVMYKTLKRVQKSLARNEKMGSKEFGLKRKDGFKRVWLKTKR